MAIALSSTMSSDNSGGHGGNGIMTTIDSEQPYFDFEIQRNVTVTVGQTGFLHCRVERLGDKDVSTNNNSFSLPNFQIRRMCPNLHMVQIECRAKQTNEKTMLNTQRSNMVFGYFESHFAGSTNN